METENKAVIASSRTHPGIEESSTTRLLEQMGRDFHLTKVDEAAFFDAYRKGDSVLLLDQNGMARGHIRMRPWLGNELKMALGVSSRCPELWELGWSYVEREFAGNFSDMRRELLFGRAEDINNGRFVTMGITDVISAFTTMKTNAVDLRGRGIGVTYYAYDATTDTRFEMLNCLTIITDPDNWKGKGPGDRLDYAQIMREHFLGAPQGLLDDLNRYFEGSEKDKFVCKPEYALQNEEKVRRISTIISIVSDKELGMRINDYLKNRFGNPQRLLDVLWDMEVSRMSDLKKEAR